MPAFYRGSTPTIRLKPLGGLRVSDLGTPTVAMTQNLVYFSVSDEDIEIDTASNSISFKLPYQDSLRFVADVPTRLQQVWQKDDGSTVVFPVHEIEVYDTIVNIEDDVDVDEDEADATTILDDDWGL